MRLKEDEAEAKLRALSDRAQEAIAAVEAQRDEAVEAARVAASKAAIDLQTANEQLAHEKQRYGTLEDQYQETLQALETERETTQRRRDKFADAEQRLKEELRKTRAEVATLTQEKMRASERLEELNDELAANQAALETERSEVSSPHTTHGGAALTLNRSSKLCALRHTALAPAQACPRSAPSRRRCAWRARSCASPRCSRARARPSETPCSVPRL
jgi:chromosome segregation ATPase